jgi:hypothetical protein
MGGANYIFEVSPEKKVVWRCGFEQFDEANVRWKDIMNYRCSYASSLYPCYFTLQNGHFENKNGKQVIGFRINNEGTEDFMYEAEIRDPQGKLIQSLRRASLSAGKKQNISVPLSPGIKNSPAVTLTVIVNKQTPLVTRELVIKLQ